MRLKNIRFKIIILFAVYIILHYLEGFPNMYGLSLAQIWKLPILTLLLMYLIYTIDLSNQFEKWTILLSLETLFSVETLYNPTFVFISSMKLLPCVLFFHFFKQKVSFNTLEAILLNLSRFICLTSLLTLLEIITPFTDYITSMSFGIEEQSYYSSLFGAPHAASSYFAVAIVVLIYFQTRKKYSSKWWKYFNYFLIIVALVSIFKAYVRTGWIILLIGLITLLWKQIFSSTKYAFAVVFLFVGLSYLYNNNEAFNARVAGRNIYTNDDATGIDMYGSGRTDFWKNGISLWKSGNTYELLFGQGYTAVTENNENLMGLKVFSHNQFVDTLSQNGLFGLILLLAIFISQYKYISCRKNNDYYRLCLAIFFMTVVFSALQNEIYFDYAVIYASCLAILSMSREYDNNSKRTTQKKIDNNILPS